MDPADVLPVLLMRKSVNVCLVCQSGTLLVRWMVRPFVSWQQIEFTCPIPAEVNGTNQNDEDCLPEPPTNAPTIRIEHHPNSGLPDVVLTLDEYVARTNATVEQLYDLSNPAGVETNEAHNSSTHPPWYPFRTQADFDFAEFVSMLRLSNPEIDALIKRHKTVWMPSNVQANITFNSHRD
jgi:hypothetical protein